MEKTVTINTKPFQYDPNIEYRVVEYSGMGASTPILDMSKFIDQILCGTIQSEVVVDVIDGFLNDGRVYRTTDSDTIAKVMSATADSVTPSPALRVVEGNTPYDRALEIVNTVKRTLDTLERLKACYTP